MNIACATLHELLTLAVYTFRLYGLFTQIVCTNRLHKPIADAAHHSALFIKPRQ
jgi:hypothetical protein